jgi:hypothetical protein
VDCGLWTVDCGLWTVDCGLWTVDCGLWTVDCGLWTVDWGLVFIYEFRVGISFVIFCGVLFVVSYFSFFLPILLWVMDFLCGSIGRWGERTGKTYWSARRSLCGISVPQRAARGYGGYDFSFKQSFFWSFLSASAFEVSEYVNGF